MKASDAKSLLLGNVLALGPYLLVAWGFTALADGDRATFWYTFGVIICIRLLIACVEALVNWVHWRAFGRKSTVDAVFNELQLNSFPQRLYDCDSFSDYLSAIISNEKHPVIFWESYDCELPVRFCAARIETVLAVVSHNGIWKAMRMQLAYEEAFQRYAPLAKSKHRLEDQLSGNVREEDEEEDGGEPDFISE